MSDNIDQTTADKLLQTIERIERLEDEKQEVADQIKEVYSEAKAFGFDTKALRQIIRLRKIDRQQREEMAAVIETYMAAIGEL